MTDRLFSESFVSVQTILASSAPSVLPNEAAWLGAMQLEQAILTDPEASAMKAFFSLRQIEQSAYLPRTTAVVLMESLGSATTQGGDSQVIVSEKQSSQDVSLVTMEEAQNHLNYYLTGFNNWNILFDLDWSQMVASGPAMNLLVLEQPQIASSNFEGAASIIYQNAPLQLICAFPEQGAYDAHVAKVIASLDTKLKKRGRKVTVEEGVTTYQNAALKHSITFQNVALEQSRHVLASQFGCNRILYTGRDFLLAPSALVSLAAGTLACPWAISTVADTDRLLQYADYGYTIVYPAGVKMMARATASKTAPR